MALEVVNAQKKGYDFKVDIWSIRCVVLEMWAGKLPWAGGGMVAVIFKVGNIIPYLLLFLNPLFSSSSTNRSNPRLSQMM